MIIDTPPMLRVGDAMTMSTRADGLLIVVRLNVIRRPMLSELHRLLATAPGSEARLRRHRLARRSERRLRVRLRLRRIRLLTSRNRRTSRSRARQLRPSVPSRAATEIERYVSRVEPASLPGPDRTLEASGAAPDLVEDVVSERTRELIRKRRFGRTRRRGWVMKRALAVADMAGLTLAFLLARTLLDAPVQSRYDSVVPAVEFFTFFLSLPLWFVLARVYGLYDNDETRTDHSSVDDLFGLFHMLTVGTWVFFTLTWLTGLAHPTVPKLLLFWGSAIVFVALARGVARSVCRHLDSYVQNTVIVGAGHVGQSVAHKLLQHPEYGVNLVGFVDEHPRERGDDLDDLTRARQRRASCRRSSRARHRACHHRVLERARTTQTLALIRELNDARRAGRHRPALVRGARARRRRSTRVEGMPLLGLPPARSRARRACFKRAMDIAALGVGLVVLSPLFALVALAIKLDSPGPVLFRQMRMGEGDRPFRIFKFRTMAADADEPKHEVAHLNKHARRRRPRCSRSPTTRASPASAASCAGTRSTSCPADQRPAGRHEPRRPAPADPRRGPHVDDWGSRRLDLKPGMTGLWQVLGRDEIPFGEMVEARLPLRHDMVGAGRREADAADHSGDASQRGLDGLRR